MIKVCKLFLLINERDDLGNLSEKQFLQSE